MRIRISTIVTAIMCSLFVLPLAQADASMGSYNPYGSMQYSGGMQGMNMQQSVPNSALNGVGAYGSMPTGYSYGYPSARLGFGMSTMTNYYNPYGTGQQAYATNTTPYGSQLQASNTYSSIYGSGSVNASFSFPGYLINSYGPYGSGTSTITSSNPGLGFLGMAGYGLGGFGGNTMMDDYGSGCFDSDDEMDFEDKWDDDLSDLFDDLKEQIEDDDVTTINELREEQDDFENDFEDDFDSAQDDACSVDVSDDLDDYEDDFMDDIQRKFNTLRAML